MAMHRPSKYPALKLSLSLSFFYFYLKLCTTYILHTKQNTNDRHTETGNYFVKTLKKLPSMRNLVYSLAGYFSVESCSLSCSLKFRL